MRNYAKLKSLGELPVGKKATAQQIKKAAGALASALKKESSARRMRFVLLDKGKKTTFSIDHGGGKSKASRNARGKADFEVRGSNETLSEIGAGRLSPIDAYLTGRLEIHGDLEYGKRIYARLAARGRQDL